MEGCGLGRVSICFCVVYIFDRHTIHKQCSSGNVFRPQRLPLPYRAPRQFYVYNNNNHHITVIIIIIITGTDMVLQYRPSLTGGNGGLSWPISGYDWINCLFRSLSINGLYTHLSDMICSIFHSITVTVSSKVDGRGYVSPCLSVRLSVCLSVRMQDNSNFAEFFL